MKAPWNASWTAEDSYEVRPCRWAGGKLAVWSPHKPGEGKPVFAKPHMVRQRRSIIEMRCTVCGEKTTPADRWWFGLGVKQEGYFMTTEAPVHRACADLASKLCPHIRSLDLTASRFPASPFVVLKALVGGPAVERDFGLRITPDRPVVGHLKIAWPTGEPTGPQTNLHSGEE
ncbi:MAG: hypothetical protein ACMVO3_22525 [Thalassobaculum sp.]